MNDTKRIATVTSCLAIALLGGLCGCATGIVRQLRDDAVNKARTANWQVSDISAMHHAETNMVIVAMTASPPHSRRRERYFFTVDLDSVNAQLREGRIQRHQHIGEYFRHPDPQFTFPIEIPIEDITQGAPDPTDVAAGTWTPLPVVPSPHGMLPWLDWEHAQQLPPPRDTPVRLYRQPSNRHPNAIAIVMREPVLGLNHAIYFEPRPDRFKKESTWHGILLPPAVAFDIVTAPVQIPILAVVFLYQINRLKEAW